MTHVVGIQQTSASHHFKVTAYGRPIPAVQANQAMMRL